MSIIDPIVLALIFSLTNLYEADAVFVTVTLDELYSWFRDRSAVVANNKDIVGFTVAQRINGKDYAAAPGVFSESYRTQIVQGLYDQKANRVVESRLMKSNKATAPEVVRMHEDGTGLVIYT